MKECVLEPNKKCNDCGNCELCDLEPTKRCDNCCRCLEGADYRAIEVTEIILPDGTKLKPKSPQKDEEKH